MSYMERNFKIWNVVDDFKEWANNRKGWKVYTLYDLIQVNNKYYKFVWTKDFHEETFKQIITKQSCSLGRHLSYQTVEASYFAWILGQKPEPIVWNLVKNTPCLSKRVAIYSLNKSFDGIINCLKLNRTGNIVLSEFESFLQKEYGIHLKPFNEKATNIVTKYAT